MTYHQHCQDCISDGNEHCCECGRTIGTVCENCGAAPCTCLDDAVLDEFDLPTQPHEWEWSMNNEHGPHCEGCQILGLMAERDAAEAMLSRFQPLGNGVYRVGGARRNAITGRYIVPEIHTDGSGA